MIVAAGLCVLLGLGLFLGGILTGVTAFYWGCVAVCVVAAVLLFLARRKLTQSPGRPPGPPRSVRRPRRRPRAPAPTTGRRGSGRARGSVRLRRPGGATAASVAGATPAADLADPPVEEVEVTDLLVVVDLKDEVLVVDEHPRYHVDGCVHLAGHTPIPLPLDEARTDGFTPCAVCAPDRTLAQRARDRKAAGSS
ncbi:hypothetical protein [Blastococcus brunescens]|uniref:Uncharacterized protein n=1 Tax=Blastococcus brunescens TaxID=1564165 RepID=A0ABZ1B5L2_9ACTN|nr:hypothetical protein [Blastococcus sp. BMG 8361]WRL66105.1 hypothetical protein U6N30_11580 [Blastococcus sp. BMG 8361]